MTRDLRRVTVSIGMELMGVTMFKLLSHVWVWLHLPISGKCRRRCATGWSCLPWQAWRHDKGEWEET